MLPGDRRLISSYRGDVQNSAEGSENCRWSSGEHTSLRSASANGKSFRKNSSTRRVEKQLDHESADAVTGQKPHMDTAVTEANLANLPHPPRFCFFSEPVLPLTIFGLRVCQRKSSGKVGRSNETNFAGAQSVSGLQCYPASTGRIWQPSSSRRWWTIGAELKNTGGSMTWRLVRKEEYIYI